MDTIPTQPSLTPQPQKKKWHSSVTLSMVLIIVFFLALIAAWFAVAHYRLTVQNIPTNVDLPVHTVKVDPTADWKTYTNSQYGFEFKYPSNGSLNVYSNQQPFEGNKGVFSLTFIGTGDIPKPPDPNAPPCPEPCDVPQQSGIMVDSARLNLSVADTLTDQIKQETTPKKSPLDLSPTVSYVPFVENGFSGVSITYTDIPDESVIAYRVLPSGKVIELQWSRANNQKTNDFTYQKYLIPILSTFKFKDTSSSPDTSTWKTYTEPGFSIQYPADWTYKQIELDTNVVAFSPPGKTEDIDQGYVGDIFLSTYDNPGKLDLKTFYGNRGFGPDYFKDSATQTPLTINGYAAEKFTGVSSIVTTDVISVNKVQNVVEISDIGRQHSDDGVFETMAKSIK